VEAVSQASKVLYSNIIALHPELPRNRVHRERGHAAVALKAHVVKELQPSGHDVVEHLDRETPYGDHATRHVFVINAVETGDVQVLRPLPPDDHLRNDVTAVFDELDVIRIGRESAVLEGQKVPLARVWNEWQGRSGARAGASPWRRRQLQLRRGRLARATA
jgi:hypothetical protein